MPPAPRPRRRPGRPPRWVVAGVAAAALLTACGTSGRELRPAPSGATAPPRTEQAGAGPTSIDGSATAAGSSTLQLTAADFAGGESLPASASCDGDGTSPALSWSGIPDGTAELALTVVDPDAGGAVHWAVTAIPPDAVGAARGEPPAGSIEHSNVDELVGWSSVCPPDGETHTYELTLYALPEPLALDDTATGDEVVAALGERAAAGTATFTLLVGTYAR